MLPQSEEYGQTLFLYFKCRNLKNKDINSASDPQLTLYQLQNNQRVIIGTSEIVKDTLSPEFTHQFPVFYNFEIKSYFQLEIFDVDQYSKDFLGTFNFELGEIVGNKDKNKYHQLLDQNNKSQKAEISITYEKMVKSRSLFQLQFRCENVEDIEFFSKSDPFLRIYKHHSDLPISQAHHESVEWKLIYQTEFFKNNLNPNFQPFYIEDQKLCNGNLDKPIKVEVWDYSKRGKHSLIGYTFLNVKQIHEGTRKWIFQSIRKKKKSAGVLNLVFFTEQPCYDFIDYLQSGVSLNTIIGIDFTISNIEPHKPNSLHFISQNPNQYQSALYSVVSIIQNYDIDKFIPVFGFGGKYKTGTSHCFPLSGDEANPFATGVDGVLQLYQTAIHQYPLSGPTNFSPIINQTIQICQQESNILNYNILVIFTDGLICDMDETITTIVEASYYPLSIIIIGVGNENFQQMEFLDSDGNILKDRHGKQAMRDIVQFVPFKKFSFQGDILSQETLRELPQQIVEFYRKKNVYPPQIMQSQNKQQY